MDFDMSNLFSSMMIGMIGLGYFMYGKKNSRMYPLIAGLLLSIYPFFVSSIILQWLICIGIMVGVYFLREQ